MKTYSYEAITKDGNNVTGTIEAVSETLVIDRLHDMDYYPLKISTKEEGDNLLTWFQSLLKDRVREKEIMTLSYQLSVLLEAGFALDRSLSILSELTEGKRLKEIIMDLHASIRSGKSLSDALLRHSDVFPPIYINMVKAGEAGGILENTLLRMASYLEDSQKLKEDVRSALIYPCLLSTVGGIAIIVLFVFVLPRFASIFSDMGQALPLSTLILLSVSSVVRNYWWVIAAFISTGLLWLRYYLKSDTGREHWDNMRFKLPLFGKLYKEFSVARFVRTLGTLLQSGVPILNALHIVEETLESKKMAEMISSVREGVKKGKGIARMLKENTIFPAFAVHMITVGEESGRLDEMLIKIADRLESEVRSTIKRLLSLLEPGLILFMGLVVGFIVISVLLAIFSLNDLPF